MIYVLSISAGKDSTALWLWAKRSGLAPRVQVAQDTGWEFGGTAEIKDWRSYLFELETRIGEPLTVVSAETQFAARVRKHRTFPGNVTNRRWCTQELKLEPMRDFLDRLREETGEDVTVVVGVRAEESKDRAELPEHEWSDFYDCWIWRPLLRWTLKQVIDEHHAAGVPLNPLYQIGAERVGCWPCVRAGKVEIRLVADHTPERIDEIAEMEMETGNIMFTLEAKPRKCDCGRKPVKRVKGVKRDNAVCSRCGGLGVIRKLIPTPIRDMVVWARTSRGGRRLPVVREPSGCARWGLCEAPVAQAELMAIVPQLRELLNSRAVPLEVERELARFEPRHQLAAWRNAARAPNLLHALQELRERRRLRTETVTPKCSPSDRTETDKNLK